MSAPSTIIDPSTTTSIEWTPGGHGLLGAVPRSYQVTPEHPRPATSDTAKVVKPNGRQPERDSARRRSRSLHLASDVTDEANQHSKPDPLPRSHGTAFDELARLVCQGTTARSISVAVANCLSNLRHTSSCARQLLGGPVLAIVKQGASGGDRRSGMLGARPSREHDGPTTRSWFCPCRK